jgi:hypothetical protein
MRTSPNDRKEAALAVSPARRLPFKKEYGNLSKDRDVNGPLPLAKEIRPCDVITLSRSFVRWCLAALVS